MKQYITGISAILIATAAIAHDGVKNPTVKARMAAMAAISENMKTLGGMAQGQIGFDEAIAQNALDQITRHAAQINTLFELPETDPKSEALPKIWSSWGDFTAKSDELTTTSKRVSAASLGDIQRALGNLGATCKACHKAYRM